MRGELYGAVFAGGTGSIGVTLKFSGAQYVYRFFCPRMDEPYCVRMEHEPRPKVSV